MEGAGRPNRGGGDVGGGGGGGAVVARTGGRVAVTVTGVLVINGVSVAEIRVGVAEGDKVLVGKIIAAKVGVAPRRITGS